MKEGNSFYTEEEIKNRQSMSTVFFWKYRPFGVPILTELARNGITKIELLESREQFDMTDMRSMKHIADICKSCGIEIVAYHAHCTHFEDADTEQKRKADDHGGHDKRRQEQRFERLFAGKIISVQNDRGTDSQSHDRSPFNN